MRERRQQFIGGLGTTDIELCYRGEQERDHSDVALRYLYKALGILCPSINLSNKRKKDRTCSEYEMKVNHIDEGGVESSRIHYLVGGILMSKGQYVEATESLRRALHHSERMSNIRFVLQRALVNCFKELAGNMETSSRVVCKNVCNDNTHNRHWSKEASEFSFSLLLDKKTSSLLSRKETKLMADIAFSVQEDEIDETIEWPFKLNASAPFHFSFTFPVQTYARAGDTVPCVLCLRSNLSIPVNIGSITIITNVNTFTIPTEDIIKAGEQILHHSGEVSMNMGTTIFIPTQFTIPNVSDEVMSSGLGDKQSTVVATRKRTTSGLTHMGGGSFIMAMPSSTDTNETLSPSGGMPVCCLALCLEVRHSTTTVGIHETNTKRRRSWDVKIHSSYRGSLKSPPLSPQLGESKTGVTVPVQQKPRGPVFEENNYIKCAWGRDGELPLTLGPRCLRVLAPSSQLKITDLTAQETGGKVMEGTVNRILLELKAGHGEICQDLKMAVTCTNSVTLPDGTVFTSSPTKETLQTDNESKLDENDKSGNSESVSRPPLLVKCSGVEIPDRSLLHDLPNGWIPLNKREGTEQSFEWQPVISSLKPREVAYATFDVFRQLSSSLLGNGREGSGSIFGEAIGDAEEAGDVACRTDFLVKISYRQCRLNCTGDNDSNIPSNDIVTKEYLGFLIWCPPMRAQTNVGTRMFKSYPCGNRHPSNMIVPPTQNIATPLSEVVVNGEKLSIRCILESREPSHKLVVKVKEIRFKVCC